MVETTRREVADGGNKTKKKLSLKVDAKKDQTGGRSC